MKNELSVKVILEIISKFIKRVKEIRHIIDFNSLIRVKFSKPTIENFFFI